MCLPKGRALDLEAKAIPSGNANGLEATQTYKVRGKGQTRVKDQAHHDVALMVVKTGLILCTPKSVTSVIQLPNHEAIGEEWKRDHHSVYYERQAW